MVQGEDGRNLMASAQAPLTRACCVLRGVQHNIERQSNFTYSLRSKYLYCVPTRSLRRHLRTS